MQQDFYMRSNSSVYASASILLRHWCSSFAQKQCFVTLPHLSIGRAPDERLGYRFSSSSSSTRWKSRQGRDSFAREAKAQGLKSRAAFKLLEVGAQVAPEIVTQLRYHRSIRNTNYSKEDKRSWTWSVFIPPLYAQVSDFVGLCSR